MKVQAPFGFVTGCHAGDKFMVQATLASMRHYCPTVPICLTVDGDIDVSDLKAAYDLIILRVDDLPSTDMKKLIARSFHAKHAAMWEGPFEFYIWIDSDALIWGDFTSQIRTDQDFLILWDSISVPIDAESVPSWMPHYYFDSERLRRIDPDFEWRGLPYFCAGVFGTRRNAISFGRYQEMIGLERANPGLFAFGDMGMLNYLVHSEAQRGRLKTSMLNLQHIPDCHGDSEFKRDCAEAGWRFPKNIKRPRIAHFCGRKPFIFDRKAYSQPFTIARLEHYRRHGGIFGAWAKILREDGNILISKAKKRLFLEKKLS